jgi:membrane protein YqaA with SNARE-associated domain
MCEKADKRLDPDKDAPLPETEKPAAQPVSPWRIVALVVALGLTVLIYLYRDRVAQFASYGYLGLFVVSVVGNATILLPVPSLAATFVAGRILNPWLVGLVSAAGMAIGELSGYLAGYGGTAIVEARDRERYQKLESWMRRHGFLTIFVLGVIPNPIFDLAGVAAGMLHFPLWYFLLACFLGKLVKAVVFAFAGAQSLTWFERFLR